MYSTLPAFVSALFLGFGVYVLLTEGVTRLSAPFATMCFLTFAWQGTWAFLFQNTNPVIAGVLVKVGYFFILFLPTTFYHFVIELTERRDTRSLLMASYALCVILAVLLATSDEVVAGFGQYFFGDYPQAGRLHPVHVLQTVLLAVHSGWLLIVSRRRAKARHRRRLLTLCLVSLGLYSFAAGDYAVNYGVVFYPPGVIFIAVSLGILAVTIVRDGLMRQYLLATTVAEEVALPLEVIGMHADELAQALPELLRGYQLAVRHELLVNGLYPGQSERLPTLTRAIRRQIDNTSTVVEMSLASITLDRLDRRSFAPQSVRHCVDAALNRYPFAPGERRHVFVIPIDAQLHFSGTDSLFIFVIFNLLKNALHSISAGNAGNITISAGRDGGFCVIHFNDTGPGIPASVLPHIFDPFYSTDSLGNGGGIGLEFCRRVCEAFGGTISCESTPGVLTTFTLRLPEPSSASDRAAYAPPLRARRSRAGQGDID